MLTLGFLGGSGEPALQSCELAFIVPSETTGRIQESHIAAGHSLMELIEDALIETGAIQPITQES